jgi:arsenite/tail-anchored protein-transporting ATPase
VVHRSEKGFAGFSACCYDGAVVRALSKRLQLITGKGGVGKSSVVAALALQAARRGRRPLIVELGHRATMQSLFQVPDIGFEPVCVTPGIFALNIELERAIREYIIRYVRLPRLVDRVLGNAALRRFFDAAPGVPETVTLAKLKSLFGEKHQGLYRWDPILVDLDATGHALMLLELPRVFDELLGKGPLRGLMQSAADLLCDPEHTVLHLVATPRSLVVQETRQLHDKLRRDHRVPLGVVFFNQMPKKPLGDAALAALAEAKQLAKDRMLTRLYDDIRVAELAIERYERARGTASSLTRDARLSRVDLPEIVEASSPREVIDELASQLPEVW